MRLLIPKVPTQEWLDKLDDARVDEPKKVCRVLEKAASKIPNELVPKYCSVYGATLRQLDRLDDARHCYIQGLKRARTRGEAFLEAQIIHRLSVVQAADGEIERSLGMSSEATVLFLALGADWAAGQTLASQSTRLFHIQRYEDAIRRADLALEFLDPEDHRFKLSAVNTRAHSLRSLGKPVEAVASIEKAKMLAPRCGRVAELKVLWLQARIYSETGEHELAADCFSKAHHCFLDTGLYLDAALSAVELINQQMKFDLRMAIVSGQAMATLLLKVESGIAAEAVKTLVLQAQAGKLQLLEIERAKAAIRATLTKVRPQAVTLVR